jgi:hypothetical protein
VGKAVECHDCEIKMTPVLNTSVTEGLAGRRREEVFGFGVKAWFILYMIANILDVVYSGVLL